MTYTWISRVRGGSSIPLKIKKKLKLKFIKSNIFLIQNKKLDILSYKISKKAIYYAKIVYILIKLTKTFPEKILDTPMDICFAYIN